MTNELDQPQGGRIADGRHLYPLRVFFEDTDAGGVVYHANYLRFMERARSDLLRVAGIDQRAAMDAGNGVYVVAELSIRYRRPARLDDALLVVSHAGVLAASSAVIHQRVMRGEEELAAAEVTVVLVGPGGRPIRQPADWIARFGALRGD